MRKLVGCPSAVNQKRTLPIYELVKKTLPDSIVDIQLFLKEIYLYGFMCNMIRGSVKLSTHHLLSHFPFAVYHPWCPRMLWKQDFVPCMPSLSQSWPTSLYHCRLSRPSRADSVICNPPFPQLHVSAQKEHRLLSVITRWSVCTSALEYLLSQHADVTAAVSEGWPSIQPLHCH